MDNKDRILVTVAWTVMVCLGLLTLKYLDVLNIW